MTITITIAATISITYTIIMSTVYVFTGRKEGMENVMENTLCVLSSGLLVGNEGMEKNAETAMFLRILQ